MRVLLWILTFICTLLFVIVGIYSMLGLIIAAFILTGMLSPGSYMYVDTPTPTLLQALVFGSVGTAIAIGFAFVRHMLLKVRLS